ncbi:hypothetical protein AB0C96_23680 [Streptomyces sp. NPDC048506]|uniref:hypothetical protein n=1 Tax=Streptomyces sp. NPDC048506 TaxID=3155028 RepID=UPI0034468046
MREKYTGEEHAQAKEAVKGKSSAPDLLPVADAEQAVLESEVMRLLGCGGSFWPHPIGFSRIDLTQDLPVLHLDAFSEWRGRRTAMSNDAVHSLLPSQDSHSDVHGVSGLRVHAIHGEDLHLTMAGSSSRLVLRGTPGADWEAEIDELASQTRQEGCRLLWGLPTLAVSEQSLLRILLDYREMSWLGSGLLRRNALLWKVSSAFSAKSWIHGGEWIFELDALPTVEVYHNELLARLTDPVWGLPLRIVENRCRCTKSDSRPDYAGYECTYHLGSTQGKFGGLQIRFRVMSKNDLRYFRGERVLYENLEADRNWLKRAFPSPSKEASGCSAC